MKNLLCTAIILSLSLPGIQVFAQDNTEHVDVNPPTIVEEDPNDSSRGFLGMILEDNVNFRKSPGLSSPILGQLHRGTWVSYDSERNYITKDGYTWAPIIYNRVAGWVATQYISLPG